MQSNVEIVHYEIGADFLPISVSGFSEKDYLYLVDYFGQLENSSIDQYFCCCSGRIIIDAAQSYFREYRKDIDIIYTCRKFFGVPDGGFLRLKNDEILDLEAMEIDRSDSRMKHLIGRLELSASDYYEAYQKNEEKFYTVPIRKMSRITRCLLSNINYEKARKSREENFKILDKNLSHLNKIDVLFSEGPYAYPLMLDQVKSEIVRKCLINNRVYVPTLWPNVLKSIPKEKKAFEFAWSIIPLPIDQRYDKEDMETIINLIRSVINA